MTWELPENMENFYNWNTLWNPGTTSAGTWNSSKSHISPGTWNSQAMSSCIWSAESCGLEDNVATGSFLQNSGYWESEPVHGPSTSNQFQKPDSYAPCQPVSLSMGDCMDNFYVQNNCMQTLSSSSDIMDSWEPKVFHEEQRLNYCFKSGDSEYESKTYLNLAESVPESFPESVNWAPSYSFRSRGSEYDSKTSLNLAESAPELVNWTYSGFQQTLASENDASMYHNLPKGYMEATGDTGYRKIPPKRHRRRPTAGGGLVLGDLGNVEFLEKYSLASGGEHGKKRLV